MTVDDAVESVVDFANGAVGTIEATRFASGRKNALQFEINGSKGSLVVRHRAAERAPGPLLAARRPGKLSQGFRTVLVSEADHPFWEHWWPQGHMIGWEHTFVHEIHHFLDARSATTPRSARTARRSRTATAPRRSATRCCAPPSRAAARTSSTGPRTN